jgi:hypothetical protein
MVKLRKRTSQKSDTFDRGERASFDGRYYDWEKLDVGRFRRAMVA